MRRANAAGTKGSAKRAPVAVRDRSTEKAKRKLRKRSSPLCKRQMFMQTNCTLCGVHFGDDKDKKKDEGWIECCKCGHWFHESCGEDYGLLDDEVFYCKSCV